MSKLFYTILKIKDKDLLIGATNKGLSFVGSFNAGMSEISKFRKEKLVFEDALLFQYKKQLKEYFQGKRMYFDFPLDFNGTDYQKRVWEIVRSISYGTTISYSDIAKSIGNSLAVRSVASAVAANPLSIVIPCHRVIAKSGKISGYRGGVEMKKFLLNLEFEKTRNSIIKSNDKILIISEDKD